MWAGAGGYQGDVGRKKVPLLGPPPLLFHPLPAKLTCSPAGKPRGFRDPRLRTAGHRFTQLFAKLQNPGCFPIRKTDNCALGQPPTRPAGALCFWAGRARLHHSAKPSAHSAGPSPRHQTATLTPAPDSASTLKFPEIHPFHRTH